MSDIFNVTTELGKIAFSKNTIGKIVVDAVKSLGGKVFLSNHRAKVLGASTKNTGGDGTSAMEINFGEEGVSIRFFVVIKFGTSISMTTNHLIEKIYNDVKRVIGVAPISVSVVVAGTMSKNTKRRNIEVKKSYDDY